MVERTVIVVGAGIGGLAVAQGLLRHGWDVTVFERSSDLRAEGAGIALAPNAVRAVDWLGLGDSLRTHGFVQGPVGIRRPSGRWMMRTNAEQLQQRFGVPSYSMHRSTVQAVLLEGLDGVIRTGHTVTALAQDEVRAQIEFDHETGGGTAEADLVVAADGVSSRLRAMLFPGCAGPVFAGYVAWRGLVAEDRYWGNRLGSTLTETWGRGHRFGIGPLSDGRGYWYATASWPSGSGRELGTTGLAELFGGWHDPIPDVLDANEAPVLCHDIVYLAEPLPSYVDGRVALLGDAAHAATPDLGQGAALALEDAVVLVAALDECPNVPEALERYHRERRERCQRMVRASAMVGRIGQWDGRLATGLRNTVASLVPARSYLKSGSETYSWRPPA
jgi:2-polyprenyl-6-methoxyphenol hydroxylase-like FAD-dependent oxidoreductase